MSPRALAKRCFDARNVSSARQLPLAHRLRRGRVGIPYDGFAALVPRLLLFLLILFFAATAFRLKLASGFLTDSPTSATAKLVPQSEIEAKKMLKFRTLRAQARRLAQLGKDPAAGLVDKQVVNGPVQPGSRNPRGGKSMKRVILVLAALALSAGSAQATFLNFDDTTTNRSIASDWGSNVSAAERGIGVDNGATPNVTLTWSAGNGGTWEFYNDKEWTAAQMDGFAPGAYFDLLFTPDAGYAVQVTSFVFDNYAGYKSGSMFGWQLFEDGALLTGGIQRIGDGVDQEIATEMADAYAGPVLLRLTALLGDGKDAALDSISFTQTASASVPEPGTLALLSAVLLGLWACGRKKPGSR